VGPSHARNRAAELTRYLLDTTTLIAHLRGDKSVHAYLLGLLANGHALSTSCVNIAEVEHGLRPKERKSAAALLDRLDFWRQHARPAVGLDATRRISSDKARPSTPLMRWLRAQRVFTEPS
jgi:predicted nucleic acid-binding protein